MSGPGNERGGSLLPSHFESTAQGGVELEDGPDKLDARYRAADKHLHELEEELDVLLHSSRSIREQRTKMTLGHLKHLDSGATKLDNGDQIIDDYLALVKKSNLIDDVIKTLKDECTASRFQCSVIRSQIRSSNGKPSPRRKKREGTESKFSKIEVTDDESNMENRLADFAGVAGAFGSGFTYSTTFSASRGRLDILSWAFACFLSVMIDWAILKLWASLPRRRDLNGGISMIIRSEHPGFGGAIVASMIEQRSLSTAALALGVAVPLVAGFTLLGVSMITLDTEAHIADPGSRIASKASGYYIVGTLGWLLLWTLVTVVAYPAIRRLCQLQRLIPSVKDYHIPDFSK